MRIAFDFNGVLDTYPETLWPFIKLLQASGHEVGFCTGNAGGGFPEKYKDQFDFTIFCDNPEEELRASGKIAKNHEEKMRYWKSAVLKENNVDIIFEDWADAIEGTTAIQIGKSI